LRPGLAALVVSSGRIIIFKALGVEAVDLPAAMVAAILRNMDPLVVVAARKPRAEAVESADVFTTTETTEETARAESAVPAVAARRAAMEGVPAAAAVAQATTEVVAAVPALRCLPASVMPATAVVAEVDHRMSSQLLRKLAIGVTGKMRPETASS
jgi:hypothetical protein